MSAAPMLDPLERSARGRARQAELTGRAPTEPATLYESTWRDYVYAEVWERPLLDRRVKFLIAIASAAAHRLPDDVLDDYLRGALKTGELTLSELREAALHLAVYSGWGRGAELDRAVTRVARELGLAPAAFEPVRARPWDREQRLKDGDAEFRRVMVQPAPTPQRPYHEGGVLNFVFAEMWPRPALDQRARRWITLVGVCEAGVPVPIASHFHAAMATGNCSPEEMYEFVLQYAVHAGWPRCSVLSTTIREMAERVAAGRPWSDILE